MRALRLSGLSSAAPTASTVATSSSSRLGGSSPPAASAMSSSAHCCSAGICDRVEFVGGDVAAGDGTGVGSSKPEGFVVKGCAGHDQPQGYTHACAGQERWLAACACRQQGSCCPSQCTQSVLHPAAACAAHTQKKLQVVPHTQETHQASFSCQLPPTCWDPFISCMAPSSGPSSSSHVSSTDLTRTDTVWWWVSMLPTSLQ